MTAAPALLTVHGVLCRETAMRLECLKRYEGMGELLAAKDQMVWKLLREREGAAADVEALSKASTTEMEEWKQCVQPSGVSTCTLSFVVFTHRLQFDRPTHGTAAEVQDGVRVLRCEVCVCVCVYVCVCLWLCRVCFAHGMFGVSD